jgi:hypothetical protein
MSTGDVTVGDLAGLSSDLRYELIDGHLVFVSRAPIEQRLVMKVLQAIDDGCPPELLAVPSLPLSFDERNEFRPAAVVIDICRGHANRSPVPLADAVLVVDFLASDEPCDDLEAKAVVYAAAGLRHWWIVGSRTGGVIAITENQLSDGSYKVVQHVGGTFATNEPLPITVDLAALSLWRSEMLQRVRPIG